MLFTVKFIWYLEWNRQLFASGGYPELHHHREPDHLHTGCAWQQDIFGTFITLINRAEWSLHPHIRNRMPMGLSCRILMIPWKACCSPVVLKTAQGNTSSRPHLHSEETDFPWWTAMPILPCCCVYDRRCNTRPDAYGVMKEADSGKESVPSRSSWVRSFSRPLLNTFLHRCLSASHHDFQL